MRGQTQRAERRRKTTYQRQPGRPVPKQDSLGLAASVQRAMADPGRARPADILALQRAAGNRAVSGLIQARLTVGPAGDHYEREADRVADQVLSMPVQSPVSSLRSPATQRLPQGEGVQTKPLAASITPLVQRAAAARGEEGAEARSTAPSGFEASPELEGRLAAHKGEGSPLPEGMRAFMEPRFGVDFSSVRIHTGGEALQMNRELRAQAFTHGQDIYLGGGRTDPGTVAGKRLLAHELTHVVQQGGAGVAAGAASSITKGASSGTIQRWDEKEHRYFGDKAADEIFKDKLTVALSSGRQVSYGKLSELGGDYAYTPEDLLHKEAIETEGWGTEAWTNYAQGVVIAGTNVNHFFPLASKEWKVQHEKALALAKQAREAAQQGRKGEVKDLQTRALVTEGFAAHFLQDSYASGHQYPRALDAVGAYGRSETETGYKTETAQLGLMRAKTYHDALCKLKGGLPLKEGRFHGDHTRTDQDERVVKETRNSLAQVVGALVGRDLGAGRPHPSDGPDVAAILADTKVDPGPGRSPSAIWQEMTGKIAGELEVAKELKDTELETSAGTKYTPQEIAYYWRRAGKEKTD